MEKNSEDRPTVLIIILNWNNPLDTIECLESVNRSTYHAFKVALIDNASSDDSVAILEAWIDSHALPVHFIRSTQNTGFAEGNNTGIRYAFQNKFDYVLLLNNDTVVPEDWLGKLVSTASKIEDLGILGCRIDYYNTDQVWFNGGYIDFCRGAGYHMHNPASGSFESGFITGCLMLIPVPVLENTGLFDEKFFLTWEDIDLSFRIKKNGYHLIVDPLVTIQHKVSRSIGARYASKYQYYFHRNRMIFFGKHLAWQTKWLFFIIQCGIMVPSWFLWQILCGRFNIIQAAIRAYDDYFNGRSGRGNI